MRSPYGLAQWLGPPPSSESKDLSESIDEVIVCSTSQLQVLSLNQGPHSFFLAELYTTNWRGIKILLPILEMNLDIPPE